MEERELVLGGSGVGGGGCGGARKGQNHEGVKE